MVAGPRTFVVGPDDAGLRLDVFLSQRIGDVSRSQLARQVSDGHVTVGGTRGTPSRKVKAGDSVMWDPPPPVKTDLVAEDIPLSILYDDAQIIVVDKPAGLVVHPAAGHESGTLVNALLARVRDLQGIGGELRPGIVHRLDKDTSGVMVVAKDAHTLAALGAAWKDHDITRKYEALVVGAPVEDTGRIETLHGRDPRDRKKFSVRVRRGRGAVTHWRVIERMAGATRIEAQLETGRTHQVRLHMAALGCPILGDATYGKPPRDLAVRAIGKRLGRQALHARTLGFLHPGTGERVEWSSEPPADYGAALAALRAGTRPAATAR